MLKDPWDARDGYIDVVLDRSPESLDRFLSRYGSHKLGTSLVPHLLMLLEMQRQCLLMYTSCGWFFDELSGN
jgi:alpha-amylase/alpha-mannosidase (GH57 family)